jgi:hypothetical protein
MRFLALVCLLVPLAVAQQPGAPSGSATTDHELIEQLLARVQQLETEVRQLRTQVASTPTESPSGSAPVPVSPAPVQTAALPATADDTHAGMGAGLPGMQIRGFSDLNYHATDAAGAHNSFALGQFNLFITSTLSDRASVLAEAVVESDLNNAFGIELERLLFNFNVNEYLNLAVGRYHTAIGYYNTAYHHATWLQTATSRPFLFEFEDKGGILPIHNVGFTATGRIPSGALGLHYVAEIGNGRTSRSLLDEPVQNVVDENNRKAVNFALYSRPKQWKNFQAGFSVYRDRLYPAEAPRIDQTIYAVHAVYTGRSLEWLNEGVLIRNALAGSGRVLRTPAFYSQVSRRFGSVRPYFRYEYMNVPSSDPIFGDVGRRAGPTAGVRYDFSEFAAFKLEYERLDRARLSGINGLNTQVSLTF